MPTAEEILKQRQLVVDEVKSWIGTPFLHARNVKGAGCDCQSIISQPFSVVFSREILVPYYSSQWHLHAGENGDFRELYIETVLLNNCIEISAKHSDIDPYDKDKFIEADLGPGDIVLAKLGRTYCHGAIVINWPTVVQAETSVCGRGSVQIANANASWYLSSRLKKFFSWKDWHE